MSGSRGYATVRQSYRHGELCDGAAGVVILSQQDAATDGEQEDEKDERGSGAA